MSDSIRVDVSDAIKKLNPKDMERAIASALEGAAGVVRDEARKYPAAPPDSSYRRTGTLGRSWAQTVNINILEAIIGNPTSYAPYVQGDGTQAQIHKGRWPTVRDIAQKKTLDVKRLIEEALARWAR